MVYLASMFYGVITHWYTIINVYCDFSATSTKIRKCQLQYVEHAGCRAQPLRHARELIMFVLPNKAEVFSVSWLDFTKKSACLKLTRGKVHSKHIIKMTVSILKWCFSMCVVKSLKFIITHSEPSRFSLVNKFEYKLSIWFGMHSSTMSIIIN